MKRVAVIGLGLMGGSMAKALKNKKYIVVGADSNGDVCVEAIKDKSVDSIWDMNSPLDVDVILLCLLPTATKQFLKDKLGFVRNGSIVSDICGIKREICEYAEKECLKNSLRFVGGHPMAGREKSGYRNSTAKLFENRSYILTPTDNTDKSAFEDMKRLAFDIGCSDVTVATPEEHDKMIAFTSQLPHILAGAYIKSPQSDRHLGFSAGSYYDVSRVASVDENLWKQLFMLNKDNLTDELDLLIKNLTEYKTALESNNIEELGSCIKRGRLLKERDINQNGNEKPHKFG